MECFTCKKTIDDDSSFCIYCGSDTNPQNHNKVWNVGRKPDNDIIESYPMVSDHHCRILLCGGNLFVEDLNSTNGTFINHRKTDPFENTPLNPGDELHLGSREFSIDRLSFIPSATLNLSTGFAGTEEIPGLLRLSIGRSPQSNLILDFPQISHDHAFLIRENGKWSIEDRGSTNGTYVNNRAVSISRAEITSRDTVYFGSYKMTAERLLKMRNGTSLGRTDPHAITITEKETIFGRDPAATVCLNSPQVSWRHARLRHEGNSFFLEDLGSTNGTYVNGSKITSCRVTPEDTISFGSFTFKLTPDQKIEKRDYRGDIRLAAENITVKVSNKGTQSIRKLVNNISLTIYPSEFVGVMGPSGSGKTTFLLALNGYLPPQTGRSLINGQSLYDNYDAFRSCIGYVPQDDILHPELTVYEALYYTAKLRLPMDMKREEMDARIDTVLEQLGLLDKSRNMDIRNVMIGSAEKKGISGGQRKRLNLAMELLTDPSLLFLDEPTSGLSSEDTVIVMSVLRQLSDEGKTIILVIHQPSLEVYRKLDNVIILASGKLMYYGPAFPDSLHFFNPDERHEEITNNADNVLKGLALRHEREWEKAYLQSPYFEKYVEGRKQPAPSLRKSKSEDVGRSSSLAFNVRQWWTLTCRYFTVKRKDGINTAILFLQAPIIAVLISIVFHNQGNGKAAIPLFLLVVAAFWFGTSNSAREIVAEKAIYSRERMINLGIPSYVLSKYAVLGFLCFLQCTVLVGIVHQSVNLDGSILAVFCVTFLVALAGLSIGLFLSSLAGTQQAAIAIVPLVLLPIIILGGGIMPVKDMGSSACAVSYLVPSRWAYEKMLRIEDAGNEENHAERKTEGAEPEEDAGRKLPQALHLSYVEMFFGDRVNKVGLILVVLGMYIFGFALMAMLALKAKDKV